MATTMAIGNTSILAILDKCFGFTKMDAGEIERIKKVAFGGVHLVNSVKYRKYP